MIRLGSHRGLAAPALFVGLFVGLGAGAVALYGGEDARPLPPALALGSLPAPAAREPIPAPAPPTETVAEPMLALDGDHHWFDGRPVRPARRIWMKVTGYSPDDRSCAPFADGITASGYSVRTNGMKLVAADTSILPLGTLVSVPGYDDGRVVAVLDRGGRIKGPRLDLLFPTHEEAVAWGMQHVPVTIWEYADGRPSGFERRWERRR